MTTKTVFTFDPSSGEFTGTCDAHESPLEPGVFHTPVYSTPIVPPTTIANETAVFSEIADAWSVVPDFRGQTVYDQTTGEPVVINALGPVAVNLGISIPASAIAARQLAEKSVMLAQAKELREKALNRLTGIQLNTTDAQTIAAIKAARQSLLDITIDAGVVAATDGASTKAAIVAAWKTIAAALAAAAPTAASVFAGLGM